LYLFSENNKITKILGYNNPDFMQWRTHAGGGEVRGYIPLIGFFCQPTKNNLLIIGY